jgi:transposase
MIDYELFAKIKHYHEVKKLTAPQIADALGIDQRTVRKWLDEKQFRPRQSVPRSSKLDPFKADIVRMLETHPYTATQVYQRLLEMGFDGRYTIVKRYVAKVRPRRNPAFLKLAFQPGECAQVDWGSYGTVPVGSATRRLSFFVMVLCYSRQMYVEFTVSQTMEHFLACHQHAFEFFGSVPRKIMVDNLKSAVLEHRQGLPAEFNPKYLDYATHTGFSIVACGVRKANEKGRVENAVGYVKKNLLAGLEISDFEVLGPAARIWLDTVANVRIHGETHKKPAELFQEELPYLQPLPAHPYDIATIREVRASSQFRVALDSNHYSVPARYAGAKFTMKLYPDRICLYHNQELVARHKRSYDHRQDFEDPDHPKELIAQRKKAREQHLIMRFLAISSQAKEYHQGLSKRFNPDHHIRKIVALADIYGTDAVARAMNDALSHNAFSCEYITNLCEQRSRKLPEPGPLHVTRGEDLLELTIDAPDLSIYGKFNPEQEEQS